MKNKGDLQVEPVYILDQKVKVLRNKSIELVKVRWTHYNLEYATWGHEETMQEEYPQMFVDL
jgi:hypothetical protein